MRIAFVGAGEVTVMTAKSLIQQHHEVIIIESNREKIDRLSEELDCSFLHGDGGTPSILLEVGPEQTDMLFCLSDNDQANLIASLVGRSLGFARVVTAIEDPDFEEICRELGLEETIVPVRTTSRLLQNMVRGLDAVELSTVLKDEARFFTFIVKNEDATTVVDLKIPEESRVICYYRDGRFNFADDEMTLKVGDEVIILTHSKHLQTLKDRWVPKQTKEHSIGSKKKKGETNSPMSNEENTP
ncbi:potassium channel family protein [Candidatus Nitrospira salsa]|nr:MAG: potassium transporter [Nitrospirales bacterium]